MNKEMLEKAKTAKNVEELLALAKENGVEITEEQAKEYFEKFNTKFGELADEELDNVAGGGCTVGQDSRTKPSESEHYKKENKPTGSVNV